MGAQIRVVIVEVDDSLNGASTGKITIQMFKTNWIVQFISFYGFIGYSEGQKADNLEPGESEASLHHQHQGKF